jgi:MoaA/NifB/PqqE/SkfB family radical SAM enzyme
MIDYATQNSGVMVTLTTNGTTMTEKRILRLLNAGIDVIDISIDAFYPETYAKVRVNGDLEITKANVLKLLELGKKAKKAPKIVVSYVEQPENVAETEKFETFWKDQGADYVVIRRLHSAAGAMPETAKIMWHKSPKNADRKPCLYPWERIVLNPRGLSFCPADWTHNSAIIDYQDTTIKEIWQGEFYKKLRHAHLSNDFTNHQFCGQCPDWQTIMWPEEGRSYASMIEDFQRDN